MEGVVGASHHRWKRVLVALAFMMLGRIITKEDMPAMTHRRSLAQTQDLLTQQDDAALLKKTSIKDEDGCGFNGGHPNWVPYTHQDYKVLKEILQCDRSASEAGQKMDRLTKLQCTVNVGDSMSSIVSQFDRIWFIGDSILRQQFWNLICMLSPNINKKEEISSIGGYGDEKWIRTTHNGTILQYTRFGWLFDNEESALYNDAFPEAIRTYTNRDAIIINAAAHYTGRRITTLNRTAHFITDMSFKSNASIFFVEASDEQWPTSNGYFTPSCWGQCQCESLTPERILGVGHVSQAVNVSQDIPTSPFDFDSALRNDSLCIPNCLPANWRNNLANPVLRNGRLAIVPLWRQLVAHGMPHSRLERGDCTHKSSDALIVMNHQLGRSMLQTLYDR
jgi:GDSL/SGNH-like Acyl-Esterase family found in Pmr5 and Cas1p